MKRFFDFVLSFVAIIVLIPVFLIISLLILITDGRPVLFIQDRVGKDNKLFKIRKFRSMKNGTRNVAKDDLHEYDSQVTPIGRFLRKTSLDELPQLFNILEGTMSFVGPRPLIPEEDEIRQMRLEADVYSVLPGVTGWAQVKGRDFVTNEEKTSYDKEYIEKKSLFFDFKILLMTVAVVLTKKNLSKNSE
ncbi:MAG: sugar transferase [Clostridia bacterium]|nr:sugar transferase [Clostridia bacterium]